MACTEAAGEPPTEGQPTKQQSKRGENQPGCTLTTWTGEFKPDKRSCCQNQDGDFYIPVLEYRAMFFFRGSVLAAVTILEIQNAAKYSPDTVEEWSFFSYADATDMTTLVLSSVLAVEYLSSFLMQGLTHAAAKLTAKVVIRCVGKESFVPMYKRSMMFQSLVLLHALSFFKIILRYLPWPSVSLRVGGVAACCLYWAIHHIVLVAIGGD